MGMHRSEVYLQIQCTFLLCDDVIYTQCTYSSVAALAVVAGDAAVQDQMSKCPFVQHKMNTESGREDALDLAFTAQAVLQGIVSPHRRK